MSDFDAWWELRGCREEYGSQESAARASWEAARDKCKICQLSPPDLSEISRLPYYNPIVRIPEP